MALIKSVTGNPDPFAPFALKKEDEYGLKIAKIIESEWFNNAILGGNDCQFLDRRNYVRNKRLFVRGEQDTQQYKDHQSTDGNLEYLNLDWTNINIAEKFCRIVSNDISDENYRLDIRSVDAITLKNKENKKNQYRKNMNTKAFLEDAKKHLGIDLLPGGFIPEDEEEMQLYMEIKERPKIEIAEELLINYIKKTNGWNFLEKQKNIDLVDLGLAGMRVYTDKNDGVKLAYVDPENYIHSSVSRNDFADKYYEGVVETITLSDLRRESNFSEFELRQIAATYAPSNKSPNLHYTTCPINEIIDHKVDVLRFAWKTSKTIVFKQKKRNGEIIKVSRKDENFVAPERKDVGISTKTLDTWFEGNYVIGANAIYDYHECENLARDVMNKAMSPFVFMATSIYENRPQSFLSNIEPIANQMQNIALKLQNFLAQLKGDITEIDLDALAELDDGRGGVKKQVWETALNLLAVKNVVFKKRIDMGELGVKEAKAVTVYPSGNGGHITALLNAWGFQYNLIRDLTGINPARDGSLKHDALLGVNQMAQLASNTATKHIVQTAVELNRKVFELISTRINGIFKYSEAEHIKEIYSNVVGQNMLDSLFVLADRHLHEFGFLFEMQPTETEFQEFKEDLGIALQEGSIDVEIKIEASRLVKINPKLATEYLMYYRRKKIKQSQDQQMMLAQNKSQNDAQAAQSKIQAELEAYSQKKQIDLKYMEQLSEIEIMKESRLQEIRMPINDKEFQQEVYLKQIGDQSNYGINKFKEDRKDDRTKMQAGQQSKLIDQRTKDREPIDFESDFDLDSMFE
jgi:hypothetical protein